VTVTLPVLSVGFVAPVPVDALGDAGVAVVVVPPDAFPATEGFKPSATEDAPAPDMAPDVAPVAAAPSLVPRRPDSTVAALTVVPVTTA
jgi:hypothetical protein